MLSCLKIILEEMLRGGFDKERPENIRNRNRGIGVYSNRGKNMNMGEIRKIGLCISTLLILVSSSRPAQAAVPVEKKNGIYYELEDGSIAPEYWKINDDGSMSYCKSKDVQIKNNMIAALDDEYHVFDRNGEMLKSAEYQYYGLTLDIDEDGKAVIRQTDDEEMLREYAAELVQDLTGNVPEQEKKLDIIFDYVYHLTFDPSVNTDEDLPAAAMFAFDTGRGNCFSQASLIHYMCQALGYKDMIIRSGDTHWWNLLKVGDNYYHVDCTPFTGFSGWNRVSTEELIESGKDDSMVRYLHTYDQDNFPQAR